MRMNKPIIRIRTRVLDERGVTMIIALGVMLVTSLLLVGAFTSANGDVHNSRINTVQKQAYYAALAGIQEYEYQLQANPDYWQKCEESASTVPTEAGERYEIKLLAASSEPEGTKCSTSAPFATMIESKGALANTFRIESVGCAGASGLTSCEGQKRSAVATRKIVATFQVTGFLDFIYYTNYETLDPSLYKAPAGCEAAYYEEWNAKGLECQTIKFTTGDSVQGPMHTNDAARVEGTPSFGRSGHNPADAIEINGDTYPSKECPKSGGPTYYTTTKCYTDKGPTLIPPQSDTSLSSYVESQNRFEGVTHLELNGTTNMITATYFNKTGEPVKEEISWPKNGLIYVQAIKETGCSYKYESEKSDTSLEAEEEKGCGNVYVKGTYSKSLTVAGENDLIINGSVYPTSVASSLGSEPTGTAVLGLIASEYVRVYNPVPLTYTAIGSKKENCNTYKIGFQTKEDKYLGSHLCEYTRNEEICDSPTNMNSAEDPNHVGSQPNIWIYAGILSTSHSFLVDNYSCGEELGKLNEYGAIAQDYRGPVGTSGGTGYLKDYKYDGRMATDEPPYFLAPLKAGWRIIRETAPNPG
jgi:Tfp pilus assembly protein PilX